MHMQLKLKKQCIIWSYLKGQNSFPYGPQIIYGAFESHIKQT